MLSLTRVIYKFYLLKNYKRLSENKSTSNICKENYLLFIRL